MAVPVAAAPVQALAEQDQAVVLVVRDLVAAQVVAGQVPAPVVVVPAVALAAVANNTSIKQH
jgi:hypothetical protein